MSRPMVMLTDTIGGGGGGGGSVIDGLLFFWRCETETLDSPSNDYTVGDDEVAWSTENAIDAGAAKIGSYGLLFDHGAGNWGGFTPSSGMLNAGEGRMGFWFKCTGNPAWGQVFVLEDSGGYAMLYLDSSRRLNFECSYGGEFAGSTALDLNTWYFIEFAWNDGAGTGEVFINGASEGEVESLNFPSSWDLIAFGSSTTVYTMMFDNIFVFSNEDSDIYTYRDSTVTPTSGGGGGGGGGDAVLFAPGYDYEIPNKMVEKVIRSISGKEYRYLWGSYRRWEVPVKRMPKADAALINVWRANNTTLYFYPFYSTAPSTYYTVKLKNNEYPLKEMVGPDWDAYYSGNLILEAV